MKPRKPYAREITKEYLKSLGVEHVSEDGSTIIVNGKEKNTYNNYSGNRLYKQVRLYDHDIRFEIPVKERNCGTGTFYLGVHVLNYVWNKGDKPQGMVIDHIDNNPLNNHISNLQCITPRENVNKDKDRPPRVVHMPKYITLEEIERKLEGWTEFYEQAKKDHDAYAAHRGRCNISLWRARHRMFLEDPEKYTKTSKQPKPEHECHARAEKRRELQAKIDSARKYYKEILAAYGKDDPITKKYWGEWKMAIAEMYTFKEECKTAKETSAKL